jgi:hypothetical protein
MPAPSSETTVQHPSDNICPLHIHLPFHPPTLATSLLGLLIPVLHPLHQPPNLHATLVPKISRLRCHHLRIFILIFAQQTSRQA